MRRFRRTWTVVVDFCERRGAVCNAACRSTSMRRQTRDKALAERVGLL